MDLEQVHPLHLHIGIHFGAEAYTDMYPQNSAEVDGMTGNGVPVAYGSGSSQYVEPPVRMGAEEGFTYMQKKILSLILMEKILL